MQWLGDSCDTDNALTIVALENRRASRTNSPLRDHLGAVCPAVALPPANPDVGWESRRESGPSDVASRICIVQCAEVPCRLDRMNTSMRWE